MDKAKLFCSLIQSCQRIVISTHVFPDADGIGSQSALSMALNSIGKNAICVNEEPLLDRYSYLDPKNTIISVDDYHKNHKDEDIDLFIVVDASSPTRIGPKAQRLMENSKYFLFIDHHPCSPGIAALHCIDTTKAATGQLVGELILSMGIELNQDIALALYTSILIDTSSFRYPTVSGDTHRLLGKLLDCGVKPPRAYNKIYGTENVMHMQLLGKVLSNVKITEDGSVAWLQIPGELIEEYNSDIEDTNNFINHLLIFENVKVACMFRSQGKHVKVSFRSDGFTDVSEIAEALGGGGHNHSAATVFEGRLDEVIKNTVKNIQVILRSMEGT